jgi:hypothetical protein
MKIAWVGLVALTALAFAPVASFADQDDYRYSREGDRSAYHLGFERGAERGRHRGWEAARHNDRYDLSCQRDYRDSDWGYRGSYGRRSEYGEGFRQGFARSYEQGYRSGHHDRDDHRNWRDDDRR